MKYLLSIVMVLLMAVPVFAADVVVPTPEPAKFTVTSPMETGAVGFYFFDGTFAAGLSQTFLRVQHSSIPKVSLDMDATIAQEINGVNKNTLAGLGVKLNYNVQKADSTGFIFVPSIGLTALNNFAQNKALRDMAQNFRIAIYGTILLYKW